MNDIVWLTMRRMRTPLIVLILVYSLTVFGMVMIPGQDADGQPIQVGYLDAAYFVAFMSTTIGFGEIPYPFTGAQRLYAYLAIYPNVVAWLYAIGAILGLFLDPQFRAVLRRARFARRVRWLGDPFFIVCGFGSTGSTVVQGLLSRGYAATVIEREEETVHRMLLDERFAGVPAIEADVADHRFLDLAGLNHPECVGVVAATSDDHANLNIAITCKLLRPDLRVLARSENERVSENMASFDTDYVVDPYRIFAERVFLALESPVKFLVQDWLLSVHGTELRAPVSPPSGRWIVCGAGRFGARIIEMLEEAGHPFTVVDVRPERVARFEHAVIGRGTSADTLEEAGVGEACGLFAGTGDDIDNLSIIMTARDLNPKLFVIARQENINNDALFDASGAQLIARRSQIIARRILAVATTPLIRAFLEHLVRSSEDFAERVKGALEDCLGGYSPHIWVTELSDDFALALRVATQHGVNVRLGHIIRNQRIASLVSLDCVCLVLERGAQRIFLPEPDQQLMEGDRLLFAGRSTAQREMYWTLHEPNALLGGVTGRNLPRGAIWRWWWRRREARRG